MPVFCDDCGASLNPNDDSIYYGRGAYCEKHHPKKGKVPAMHRIIEKHLSQEVERHVARSRELAAAQRILEQFDITVSLDDALQFHVWEDAYWDVNRRESIPADRYWITVRQPLSSKERLRPILLRNIHAWAKQHSIDNGMYTDSHPLLVETWLYCWNDHPLGRAGDRISIEFVSPAEEGHELSPTCKVELVTRHIEPRDESYLTVACKKEG